MQDIEILSQLLNLDGGFHIHSIEVDRPSNRIDIVITHGTVKKKFFGLGKVADEGQKTILRHLPIWGMRTFLHVPITDSTDTDKAWNPAGSKLSNEMEEFVIYLLNNTSFNQIVAKIAGITVAEVRAVSERTGVSVDKVLDHLSDVRATHHSPVAPVSHYATDETSFELFQSDDLPPETDDSWQRIVSGEHDIQTNAVGLQMLLQRVRQDIANNPSEVTRLNASKLLRQYFIKNRNQHKADVAIITEKSLQTGGAKQNLMPGNVVKFHSSLTDLPDNHHPIWQTIVTGKLQIQTANVALQMMMERVRQSTERNPSESSHAAAIKILRHFFMKHKERLHDEIQQMGIQLAPAESVMSIPAENAVCWNELIDGDLKIVTNTVGLQMMMERVRQSVEKNNNNSNRMAGIKILRQYFIKHQATAQNEIRQLHGTVDVMPVNNDSHKTTIPPDNHPNWQRLIDGKLILGTDIVALKMMLQSIRISIENNPSEASRHAGAKILRQYFIKHQNKHQTELEQLIAV